MLMLEFNSFITRLFNHISEGRTLALVVGSEDIKLSSIVQLLIVDDNS